MTLLAVGVAWILGGLALAGLSRVHSRINGLSERDRPSYDDAELREAVAACINEVGSLRAEYTEWNADINLAVAEGIKNVERAENRIRATVRRAREQLSEHGLESPGLEAEYRDLQVVDGGRSEAPQVPAVHEGMASPGNRFDGLPGDWTNWQGVG